MSSEESPGAGEFGQIVAGRVAVSVQGAYVLEHAQRLAEQLQSALQTRAVIDQAIGVMMSLSGGTEAEALNRLCAVSQTKHQKLAVIARRIVDGAVWLDADLQPLTTTTPDTATDLEESHSGVGGC